MERKTLLDKKKGGTILKDYSITNSIPDKDYDQLTFLTASICKVPVAFLSILDRNRVWLKSGYGINIEEINRDTGFAQAVLNSGKDIYSINYAEDRDVFDNSKKEFIKDYKFYTGLPIKNLQGYSIAVLNILDTTERSLEEFQIKALHALTNQIGLLFEFRKQNLKFQQVQKKLKHKYRELEKFTSLVSHDIKSPLANIISLTELLKEENKDKFDAETNQYLNYLVESSYSLRDYVDGILSFYRSDHILEKDYENVDLNKILKGIAQLYEVSDDIEINYPDIAMLHNVNKVALTQVFLNLISNGLKYNKKKIRKIDIRFKETENFYQFEVIDNGEGFLEEDSSKIFELFKTLETTDREGNSGTGIGLATVKKLVNSMGGDIKAESTPGIGSNFKFKIKRL
ncbi:MAG: HAMP domain-containing histidine kinase [Gillisia sp.]|nr:HAMP domain-containing histidine kinase [Gillisia sp.]